MALEQVFAATPAVGDGGRIIASPFQFLFTGEDKLQLLVVNSAAGVTVQLATRFLQAGTKTPQSSAPVFSPTADRTVNTFNIDVGAGYLLNCSAIVVAGSPLVGQTYVMVRILRGASGATLMLGAMLGGYITAKQALAYPGSPIESSIAGGGYPRTIVGTQPAVGVNIMETVPAGARWELDSFTADLDTTAAAGNRCVQLAVFSGGNAKVFSPCTTNDAGSHHFFYTWGVGLIIATRGDGRVFTMPWPERLPILAGESIQTQVVSFDAGDTWSAPVYAVREWLEAA